MKRLIPRAAARVTRMECTQIEYIDGIVDEIRKMPFRWPFLQRGWQQKLLLRIIGKVTGRHPLIVIRAARQFQSLPRRLLGELAPVSSLVCNGTEALH